MNQNLLSTNPGLNEPNHSRGQSIDLGRGNVGTSFARNSYFDRGQSQASSFRSIVSNIDTWINDQNYLKDAPLAYKPTSRNRQKNFNLELEKLRIELRHVQGMNAPAQLHKGNCYIFQIKSYLQFTQ